MKLHVVPHDSSGFPCGIPSRCCTPSRGIPLERPSRIEKQGQACMMHHGAFLRGISSYQPCRDQLGVLPSLGALRDHCPQPKQGCTLHRSCKPYSTDEVSTSSACRQEGPCEHQCAGAWTGRAAQCKGQVCSCLHGSSRVGHGQLRLLHGEKFRSPAVVSSFPPSRVCTARCPKAGTRCSGHPTVLG